MINIKYFPLLTKIKNNYSQFYQYIKSDNRLSFFGFIVITIIVITNTAMIWMMGGAINQIQSGQYDELYKLLILFGLVVSLNQTMKMICSSIVNELCLRFIGRCRNAFLKHSMFLSFPLLSQFNKGDLLARLSNDIDFISEVVVTGRLMLVSHILTLVIYITMLFFINSTLAFISLTTIPFYLIHQRFFSTRKQQAIKSFLNKNAHLLGYEEQCLSSLKGISSNTLETEFSLHHRELFNKAKISAIKERLLLNGFSISYILINYLVGLFIILVGISSIENNVLTTGHLLSFILYLGYLTIPVKGITEIFLQVSGNIAAANRVSEILDIHPETEEINSAPELRVENGTIEFSEISFAYSETKKIFTDINIHIEGKNTYALVGPSGSGKSSFVNLLMRFYDPSVGTIKIDGINIREVSKKSLRSNIAVVWQDNFHINESIKANLLLANPCATRSQLIEACIAANAWEFIAKFKSGLDTILGTNGTSLSGGQYQRISIAQAFLKNASIIIFDEASSAIDSHSEQQILTSLDALFSDRTRLIIAHRYSSIQNAKRVIYFSSDGKVLVGKHNELYEQLDDYRNAVTWQTSLQAG